MSTEKSITASQLRDQLRRFLAQNEGAVDLKNGKSVSSLKNAYLVEFQGSIFGLRFDTRTEAIWRFINLAARTTPDSALVRKKTKGGEYCLRINDGSAKADGWYCYQYAAGSGPRKRQGKRAA